MSQAAAGLRSDNPAKKRLRPTLSRAEPMSSLRELLQFTLPDKHMLFDQWMAALASPEVCITSLEDIQRMDEQDISCLPVPPLVKSVFRDVISRASAKAREQQSVLESTDLRLREYLAPQRDRNMQPPLAGSVYFQDFQRYKLILAREEIDCAVRIVARRIETWAKGDRIILVGILKGAFIFMADLCRALVRPYSVYFVEASSYKDGKEQGALDICAEVNPSKFFDALSKQPHKIVLCDELLDNGKTMQDMKLHFLSKLSSTHTENDILTCCLFSKKRSREWPPADICGVPDLPDLWLVGYGLDDRGTKRGWTELLAIPKVKLVETIEVEEVEKLLANLDENAMLTKQHKFAGFELTFSKKQKYRVNGVDVGGACKRVSLAREAASISSKAELQRLLSGVQTVKGKFEQEWTFSFIQENQHLVPEDEMFNGKNQVYAEMRCRLRRQISEAAERFAVAGPEQVKLTSG